MGAEQFITDMTSAIPGGKWGALFFMMVVLFVLGCVLDPVGIMLITLPVFLPLVKAHGFDPIWFGIIIVMVTEMGVITPPVGINVYVVFGVARRVIGEVPLESIFKGIFPFLLAVVAGIIILMMIPQIILFLPNLMY